MTRDEYLDRWAQLHGVDPRASSLVHFWLRLAYLIARPLAAARVAPNLLTLLGMLAAGTVVPLAAFGGRWPLLAVAVVVLSGLLDNLDGAVAVLTGRASRWGALLDSLADRVSEAAYCVALWALGAPGWIAALAAGLAFAQEYARARASVAGMDNVGVVTVAERPTRVIGAAMFCLGAGLYPSAAAGWGTAGAILWVLTGAVGCLQLLIVVRKQLR